MEMRILCQLWSLNAEKFLGTTKCFTNSCTIRNLNASTAYKLVFLANNFGRGSQELNTLAVKTEGTIRPVRAGASPGGGGRGQRGQLFHSKYFKYQC